MEHLRHIAPIVAVLLSVIVLAETTDLFGCPDSVIAPSRADTSAALTPDAAPLLTNAGSVMLERYDGPDGTSQERRTVPDCLCQITFVSTATLPSLGAPGERPIDYPSSTPPDDGGVVLVPSPIPLA